MVKYKHIETGLFLRKQKYAYLSVYTLDTKGTIWPRDCFGALPRTKNPDTYGRNQFWRREDFELIKFELTECK